MRHARALIADLLNLNEGKSAFCSRDHSYHADVWRRDRTTLRDARRIYREDRARQTSSSFAPKIRQRFHDVNAGRGEGGHLFGGGAFAAADDGAGGVAVPLILSRVVGGWREGSMEQPTLIVPRPAQGRVTEAAP